MYKIINGVRVKVIGADADYPEEAIEAYLVDLQSRHDKKIVRVVLTDCGEFTDCLYFYEGPMFERIRRITGYLTGKLSAWNNAKRSEEKDRVKHGVRE